MVSLFAVIDNGLSERMPVWKRLLHAKPGELAPLTGDQLQLIRASFPMPKFFIFGHARSGTTLLARLLRCHPEVHCNWQAHFFTVNDNVAPWIANQLVEHWLSDRSNRWTGGKNLSTALVRVAFDFILESEARSLGKTVVGDKSPNHNAGVAVERLHAVYPDAKLIYIVRDGRDTVISHRIQKFIDATQYLLPQDRYIMRSFERDSSPFFDRKRSLFTPRGLRKVSRSWATNVMTTDQMARSRFGGNYLPVRYEDLLAQPLDTMRSVWKFLAVDETLPELEAGVVKELESNPAADWHAQRAPRLVEDLPRGIVGGWRLLFTPRDLRIFEDNAAQALEYWRYEVGGTR